MAEYLWTSSEWSFEIINRVYKEIERIGTQELGLEPYTAQIEIITAEQMVDAYSSIGLPVFYRHWSFGKHFSRDWELYKHGYQSLAYEIVINSDPCIAYLMEENTMTMQCLTLSHASQGHSHFFRNNYLFKEWTDASSILDYLIFARDYINQCEAREGREDVEMFLNACHALQNYGINPYRKPRKLSFANERKRQAEKNDYDVAHISELFDSLIKAKKNPETKIKKFPAQPEENILWFCEKYAPDLKEWQREIIRIVRKIAQYFYPQGQTRVCNEGCATYTHHRIMNRLHELGYMTDGAMLEFLQSHTNVVMQPNFDDKRYSGINPYALGFAIMKDIERICHEPTEEDRRWFPDIAGQSDEMAVIREIWANYRDESMIRQFLSPKVIRDLRLFQLCDNKAETEYEVRAIHDDAGYQQVRDSLADQYERHNVVPQIEVTNVDPETRILTLTYTPYRGRTLDNTTVMAKHVKTLWGHGVAIQSGDATVLV